MRARVAILILLLVTMAFSGCGKPGTASSQGTNIVKKADPKEGDDSNAKNFEVHLDERTEDTKYAYWKDDISFVDTVTGKHISIGMNREKIQGIIGEPMSEDNGYCMYDGLVVQYNEEGTAIAMLVSAGMFQSKEQGTRFKTSRGVGIFTTREDFMKAYGDLYTEGETETTREGNLVIKRLSNAVRYFVVDGQKVEFLGTELTEEMKNTYTGKLYMQDFMFEHESNQVTTIRVIHVDETEK